MLKANDGAVFKRIRLEALQREPEHFASSYQDWCALIDAEWETRLVHNSVIMAFPKGDPVGPMGLLRTQGCEMMHRATLSMVYVRKEDRRCGIATNLLRQVDHVARDQNILQLELNVSAKSCGHSVLQA